MDDIQREGKGKFNQGVGKVKEEVGEATGDRSLEAEGRAQGMKGDIQDTTADVKRNIERKTNE